MTVAAPAKLDNARRSRRTAREYPALSSSIGRAARATRPSPIELVDGAGEKGELVPRVAACAFSDEFLDLSNRKLGLVPRTDGSTLPRPRSNTRRRVRLVGSLPRSEGPEGAVPLSFPTWSSKLLSESNTEAEMERKRASTSERCALDLGDRSRRARSPSTPRRTVALLDSSDDGSTGTVSPASSRNSACKAHI